MNPGDGPNPSRIMQIGTGFMASKVLLSAIELELFTVLAGHPQTAAQLGDRLGLHPRALHDFLDALVSLGFLDREGNGHDATYRNAADSDVFLDKNKPSYIAGILEMANHRLYGFWGSLTTALKTGQPQNEASKGEDLFGTLYADQARLEEFLRAMAGIQMSNFMALAASFDFSGVKTVCDVGGASGACSIAIAQRHPHLQCISWDLPPVVPIAQRHVEAAGLEGRVTVTAGDFFNDPLPAADVIVMGNVLHDWDETQKRALMKKAFDTLPAGGTLIAIENVIDDERRENVFGLLMSLNMLIETPGGFDYTAAQFNQWATEAGFKQTTIMPLTGPASAAIAKK